MAELTNERERLLALIEEFSQRSEEARKCMREVEYDADYFCGEKNRQRDEAAEALFDALDAYVSALVARKLAASGDR